MLFGIEADPGIKARKPITEETEPFNMAIQ
jgi:hypothetical protein